jgi:hypothetical protein
MQVWFMVGALVLGIIGIWGEQGRSSHGVRPADRGGEGTVTAQDGTAPIPRRAPGLWR